MEEHKRSGPGKARKAAGKAPPPAVTKEELEHLSAFRHELRKFLRFSEDACREQGISMLQYQLLLHTQGVPGRDWASIGELAERLQSQAHGAVALVDRCESAGLVRRRANEQDKRLVEVHLTAGGRRVLETLARAHRNELHHLAEVVDEAAGRLAP
jgi:DNA-binding MarR family transcriptional regulator